MRCADTALAASTSNPLRVNTPPAIRSDTSMVTRRSQRSTRAPATGAKRTEFKQPHHGYRLDLKLFVHTKA